VCVCVCVCVRVCVCVCVPPELDDAETQGTDVNESCHTYE